MFSCAKCNNTFKTASNLTKHKRTAKYCAVQNGQELERIFKCVDCNNDFTAKNNLVMHQTKCIPYHVNKLEAKFQVERNLFQQQLDSARKDLEAMSERTERLIVKIFSLSFEEQEKFSEELTTDPNDPQQLAIDRMVRRYMKRQPATTPEASNCIYALTTPSLRADRRYILGKAKNLRKRLATYNKTDEHIIIHYAELPDEGAMAVAETVLLKKLERMKEQANRERIVLPPDRDESFLRETIDMVAEFVRC